MNGYTLDMASKTLNQYSRFSWNLVLNYAYIYIYIHLLATHLSTMNDYT